MAPHNCLKGAEHPDLTEHDRKAVLRFTRFLRDEMEPHERYAYVMGEPMSSANDPESCGMGC